MIREVQPVHTSFIEFGVENYQESNTRFLLLNNHWQGLVLDGSETHMAFTRGQWYFPRHALQARQAFITAENIEGLLAGSGLGTRPGLSHIDIDGNDYWVWRAIKACRSDIVIVEYNGVFGAERAITVPYDPAFQRTRAHHSNLYFGASLAALRTLAEEKQYTFVGCNGAGNNAYFVANDAMTPPLHAIAAQAAYVPSHFRESRDPQGRLSLLGGAERLEAIRGLPVVNILTGETEAL